MGSVEKMPTRKAKRKAFQPPKTKTKTEVDGCSETVTPVTTLTTEGDLKLPSKSKSCLLPGDSLKNGEKLTSDNGQFTLCMQSDGNLVLYSGDNPLWESRTQGKAHPPYRLVMQENSNLCIYYGSLPVEDYYGYPTTSDMGIYHNYESNIMPSDYSPSGNCSWASDTFLLHQAWIPDMSKACAIMQDDGNFVIYNESRATWCTGTDGGVLDPECDHAGFMTTSYSSRRTTKTSSDCDCNGDLRPFPAC